MLSLSCGCVGRSGHLLSKMVGVRFALKSLKEFEGLIRFSGRMCKSFVGNVAINFNINMSTNILTDTLIMHKRNDPTSRCSEPWCRLKHMVS